MPVLGALLVMAVLSGLAIGSVHVAVTDVVSVVLHHLGWTDAGPTGATETIVWVVRAPRVLLACVVGAGLGVCGAALQALVRNPIADPYLLGISSGASVGAIAVIALGVGGGTWALSGLAFVGALAAAAVVIVIAGAGGVMAPLRVVLAGVAVGSMLTALGSLLLYSSKRAEASRAVVFWLLGSLSGASWERLVLPAVIVSVGTAALILRGRWLDALSVGDETAASVGVRPGRARLELLVVTSLITAAVVAVSGAIGFVGLLLPHVARAMVGTRHRSVLIVSALLGAVYLVMVDLIARVVASPEEIPVGIITAGIGAPAFCWYLWRSQRREERR